VLATAELERRLAEDRVDVTLPGDPPQPVGRLHLITQTWRELEDVFVGLGFTVLEGREVETTHYNFDALNHEVTHPARDKRDTFYVRDDVVLRTHTSPMQVRAMEAREPPIYAVVPGRVYRPDTPDATHVPMFHQLEGLAIDEDITLADLNGTLREFARAMFGPGQEVRLRPGYFPFTEPSVEVDVSCFVCDGTGTAGGERCPTCKGEAWIEILGAGMVDPNVLGYVADSGYDPERVQGFAFGMGIERIAMLKYGVPDLRMLWENEVRLLEQFGA
jgi:phenylalanyl-tRNA synthetase alpha chain